MRQRERPRIAIDMHVAAGKFQGSRTHCLELFSRVVVQTPECDFIVIGGTREILLQFSEFEQPNVTIHPLEERPAAVRLLLQLPTIAKRLGVDLLHAQYIVPPFSPCPTAVTVHDILFESHPEYFKKAFVGRSRLLVPYSARRSELVFTVSEFSRSQISRTYSIPGDRIYTIPNGVNRRTFYPGSDGKEIVQQFGLQSGSYFLTVGRLEPRKNHTALLRAWAALASPRPRLVVVGQRDFRYKEIFDLVGPLGLREDTTFLENVSDGELPALYRHAQGFVYASHAEGFGMPILEAMASGIPVISPANTALGEIGGDAVWQVDPNDPMDVSAAVEALSRREGFRETLIARGLKRILDYSWDRAAGTVSRAYKGLLLPEPVKQANAADPACESLG